jgi:hypothetical protein
MFYNVQGPTLANNLTYNTSTQQAVNRHINSRRQEDFTQLALQERKLPLNVSDGHTLKNLPTPKYKFFFATCLLDKHCDSR